MPRFVHGEGAASEGRAVEGVNRAVRRMAVGHLDEAKAAGAVGLAVGLILTVSTVRYGSKSWRRSCSVVVKARLPTKIFTSGSFEERGYTVARSSAPYADTIQE
jgi:hypothetical protein